MGNVTLQAALYYLKKLNLSIIPVSSKDDPSNEKVRKKKPLIKWEEYQTHAPTAKEVRTWFEKWPDAMIGIVTGKINNIAVIDLDTEKAEEEFYKLLPSDFKCPTVQTPRGGKHLYFTCPENLTGHAGAVIENCDLRANGNFIIAPPSSNGDARGYKWVKGLSIDDVALGSFPQEYINTIANSIYKKNNIYKGAVPLLSLSWNEGRRDESLFRVANTMAKGGASESEILQVLETIAKTWGEEHLTDWFEDKIKSAIKRQEHRQFNLTEAIERWVSGTNGDFTVTNAYLECQSVTGGTNQDSRTNRDSVRRILNRLKERGIIEASGTKDGVFRLVDNTCEDIDFEGIDSTPMDLNWPFEIERFVDTFQKSIIIVAGSPNAGKTAFLLNFVLLNKKKHKINYFSSEMGGIELGVRLRKFGLPMSEWKKAAWKSRSTNFSQAIKPDEINIIDFLEVHTDFFLVGQMIKDIYDRLNKGIAIIAIQKNVGQEHGLGLGGFRSLEKARLYLSIDDGVIKIIKGKNWHNEAVNPNRMQNSFKLVQGCNFLPEGWLRPDEVVKMEKEKKYKGFK